MQNTVGLNRTLMIGLLIAAVVVAGAFGIWQLSRGTAPVANVQPPRGMEAPSIEGRPLDAQFGAPAGGNTGAPPPAVPGR